MSQHDIGLIGLAVMGQNLVLNMASRGYSVGVFNRTTTTTDEFIDGTAAGKTISGYHSVEELVANLKSPRRVMLMVKAGPAVDALIGQLTPLLDPGDIIIDGGNTQFDDTNRRTTEVEDSGLLFIGTGVSGGEEGALLGPSIMPGGSPDAWPYVKDLLQEISAKVGPENDIPCCEWVGPAGAGHYVKMVHNGIEYGDMQLICEAYMLMKQLLGMSPDAMSKVFSGWNKRDLDSFLIQITADILQRRDPADSRRFLVDMILDTAGQKGTGKWTSVNALDMGVPAPSIAEAVFARCMSAIKDERVEASRVLRGPRHPFRGPRKKLIDAIERALYCAKICSYAQGFSLMAEASREYGRKLKFGQIAMIWRGGCIIRAGFLQKIKDAFDRSPRLPNLLLDPYFKRKLHAAQADWRYVVSMAATTGVPIPQMMSALAYFDSYRSKVLPANLLQGQRDYFGAHSFERVDAPRGRMFHVDWPTDDRPQVRVR